MSGVQSCIKYCDGPFAGLDFFLKGLNAERPYTIIRKNVLSIFLLTVFKYYSFQILRIYSFIYFQLQEIKEKELKSDLIC